MDEIQSIWEIRVVILMQRVSLSNLTNRHQYVTVIVRLLQRVPISQLPKIFHPNISLSSHHRHSLRFPRTHLPLKIKWTSQNNLRGLKNFSFHPNRRHRTMSRCRQVRNRRWAHLWLLLRWIMQLIHIWETGGKYKQLGMSTARAARPTVRLAFHQCYSPVAAANRSACSVLMLQHLNGLATARNVRGVALDIKGLRQWNPCSWSRVPTKFTTMTRNRQTSSMVTQQFKKKMRLYKKI